MRIKPRWTFGLTAARRRNFARLASKWLSWRAPTARVSMSKEMQRFVGLIRLVYDVKCKLQVICAVYGPLQRFRMRKLDDVAILRCHMYRSRFADPDRAKGRARADKETHQSLEQALGELILLENYPRTRIDIVFRVMQVRKRSRATSERQTNFRWTESRLPSA